MKSAADVICYLLKAAMDRANKVGIKNELPFQKDAVIGKYPIVLIVHSSA